MRDLGYVEGQNLKIEYGWAEGKPERYPELVAELLRRGVDAFVTSGPASTAAARRASVTIPIVTVSGDPVGDGLVANLGRPGGNTTGVALVSVDRAPKQLEILHEALPKVRRVAVLVDASLRHNRSQLEALRAAAPRFNLDLLPAEVRRASDLDRALTALKSRRPEAFISLGSALLAAEKQRILAFVGANRLPAMFDVRSFVIDGGLMSYGPDVGDLYLTRVPVYVDRIFKGAKPADLPVEQPTKFELVINMKTVKVLRLEIPPSVLLRANEVIQ
jgi:putative ABC transport system substrate-binding protein